MKKPPRSEEKKAMKSKVHIRWGIRRDFPEILEIERQSFDFPWVEEDFYRALRQRNCIGMVAEHDEHDDHVVGFMIYESQKTRLHILNFAVGTEYRRQGVGRRMVDKLKAKLTTRKGRRSRLTLEIRDGNLPGQLFFREMGFRASNVLRDYYKDTDEDAYVMSYACR